LLSAAMSSLSATASQSSSQASGIAGFLLISCCIASGIFGVVRRKLGWNLGGFRLCLKQNPDPAGECGEAQFLASSGR
jgi:hypothetical protein